MYEPIRTKSVHSVADADFPHRTRGEELDIQLAGHLSGLLAATDELGLAEAADRIAGQITRLRGSAPARAAAPAGEGSAELHRRAHALAGRALVVAAARADTAAAILAAECMDVHTAALRDLGDPRLVGAH
jgi:hypothetical protein